MNIDIGVPKENIKFLSFTDRVICDKLPDGDSVMWECTYLLVDGIREPQFTDIYDDVMLFGDVGIFCNGNVCEILNSRFPGKVGFYNYEVDHDGMKFLLVSDKDLFPSR